MAHLSVENVLIFLWHCYVEVFDFSPPHPPSRSSFSFLHLHLLPPFFPSSSLPPLSLSFSHHFIFFALPSSSSQWGSCSGATVCLSAFRFKLTQQKQVFFFFFPPRGVIFAMGAEDTGAVSALRSAMGAEQPSASNHKDLMFKLRGDWPSSLASG